MLLVVGSNIRQDINSDNIVKYIAPYLAEDNDRFHRVMAIKCAIEGKVAKGQNVAHFSANANLSDEDVSVILIPYDSQNDSPELATRKEDNHDQQTAN